MKDSTTWEPPRLTEREFRLFQNYIYREAGIFMSPLKKALLVGRLARRLRALGLASFEQYFDYLTDGSRRGERVEFLDSITTNETAFFREPAHFRFLDEKVLPEWKEAMARGHRPGAVRIWSAGCSTGEEPFSLAMLLAEHFPRESNRWFEIYATDLSARVLEKAAAGTWPIERTKDIAPAYLKRYMMRGFGSQEGVARIEPRLRERICFERLNLNGEWPSMGKFDLIFCRNVLIYFDAPSKARAVNRLLDLLEPGGYFFLGHAESLSGVTDRVRNVIPNVYVLK